VADASSITAIRTAAATAVATDLLAKPGRARSQILGSGIQAETHLAAMLLVRKQRRVRVWSRTASRGKAFAKRESKRHKLEVEFVPAIRDAVAGADMTCTTTSAKEPILEGAWVAAGAHVNVVGSSSPAARRSGHRAGQARACLYDARSCLVERGTSSVPMKEGAIGASHLPGRAGWTCC